MSLGKLVKWGVGLVMVVATRPRLGSRLRLDRGGKPVYLGRGVHIMVVPVSCMELGSGIYIDDSSRLQVSSGVTMWIGDYAYMNTNACAVAAERIKMDTHRMVGSDVCIYEFDHIFGSDGVCSELKTAPVHIGERCRVGSGAIVTCGTKLASRIIAGVVSSCSRSLSQGPMSVIRRGSYVSPARWAVV